MSEEASTVPTSNFASAYEDSGVLAPGCNPELPTPAWQPFVRFLTPDRIRTYPRLACVATIAGTVLLAVFAPQRRWALAGADFRAFYTAGAIVRAGRADLLYDVAAQASLQSGPIPPGHVSEWLLPPFAVWPFVALSGLPFSAALALHLALGVAMAAVALGWLERELGGPSFKAMAWAAIAYFPTLQWFVDGQLTAVALLALTGAFVCLRRGNDAMAGVFLGCLAYKPQLALGLFAALVGARRFSAIGAALATGIGWSIVSCVTLPGATWDYLERAGKFATWLRDDAYPTAGLHGLFQAGALLFDGFSPSAGTVAGTLLTAIALGTLVVFWLREPWRPALPEWDRRMAATLALSVIASPHLFGYDLMLLLLPFFVVWSSYRDGSRGRPLDGGPLLVMSAFGWAFGLFGPVLTVAQQTFTRWVFGRPFALQIGVVAVVAWAAFVFRLSRAPDAKRELAVDGCGEAMKSRISAARTR
jgi:hypothetical protein